MTKLPISILIPTMNRPESLKHTLESYIDSDYVPSQIVIVDQTQDELIRKNVKDIVSNFSRFTSISYFFLEKPSSTVSRNIATSLATEEIIVYSDDDVEVYSDTLYNVYQTMQDNSVSMIAGLDESMVNSSSGIGYLTGTKSFFKRKKGHVTSSVLGRFPNKSYGRVETEWAMGFFFVVRKSLLDRWNILWDEKMQGYAYAEDLDFSFGYYKRSKEEKLCCIICDNIKVKHLVSREYRAPSKRVTNSYIVNRLYISYKHKLGIASRIAIDWCDFWQLVRRIITKESPRDLVYARKMAHKLRKLIRLGDLSFLDELND